MKLLISLLILATITQAAVLFVTYTSVTKMRLEITFLQSTAAECQELNEYIHTELAFVQEISDAMDANWEKRKPAK